jgi:hypothetical protein
MGHAALVSSAIVVVGNSKAKSSEMAHSVDHSRVLIQTENKWYINWKMIEKLFEIGDTACWICTSFCTQRSPLLFYWSLPLMSHGWAS